MKLLVLPDCHVKSGNSVDYLTSIGKFIVDKKPDVVVQIGDFADMPSLSSYDVGKKSFEGRRYKADIEASHKGMEAILSPLEEYNKRMRKTKHSQYTPRLVLTLGNHENRINRAVNNDPKLEGVLSVDDLKYKEYGWEVYDFLDVVIIGGVAFSHYFITGVRGLPAATAAAQLRKANMSSVAGHQQGKQIAYATKADGTTVTSIIAGSAYEHNEDFMGPQGNKHWRGVIMLHDVANGEFNEMCVPLSYLKMKYGS